MIFWSVGLIPTLVAMNQSLCSNKFLYTPLLFLLFRWANTETILIHTSFLEFGLDLSIL